jgi:hypothetical protein
MAKFVCLTQVSNLAIFTGATSLTYQSLKGLPFVVEDKLDVECFEKNPRFKKIGFFNKPKIEQVETLETFLDTIKGFTKYSKQQVLDVYDTKEQVIGDLETSKKRFKVTEKQEELLIEALKIKL